MHHHTIQIIQPTGCNSVISLLLDVYVWFNMFRASPRPSSGAYNCTSSLFFFISNLIHCFPVYVQYLLSYFPLHVSGLTGPSSGGLNSTCSLWYSPPENKISKYQKNIKICSSSVVGRGLAHHDQQRSSRFSPTIKPEATSAVVRS